MDSIDLVSLVNDYGKLDNVEVYGYIACRLRRPSNLFDSCKEEPNGIFAKMQVFAVDLSAYQGVLKQRGIENKENNNIYLVNGELAVYIESGGVYPEWYCTRGTIRMGSNSDTHYMTMFKFKKNGEQWCIGKNILTDIELANWSADSRLRTYLKKSMDNKKVIVPDDILKYTKFTAYKTLGTVTPVEPKNSGVSNTSERNQRTKFSPEVVFDRDTLLEKPVKLLDFQTKLDNSRSLQKDFVESLKSDFALTYDTDSSVRYMVNALRTHLTSKPESSASTGRSILKKYLSKFGDYATAKYNGVKSGDYLISIFDEVSDYILDSSKDVSASGTAWKLCEKAFGDSEKFYSGVLGVILGVDFGQVYDFCENNELSFTKIVTTNPYLFLLMGTDLTYKEIDYIAYALGKSNDKGIEDYKLVCTLYNYLNDSDNGSTIYKVRDVMRSNVGTVLTKARYKKCMTYGTYLSSTTLKNIRCYVSNTISSKDYEYPKTGWKVSGYSATLPLSPNELKKGIELAKKYGVAIEVENNGVSWITSTSLFMKEMYICNKIYELSESKMGYSHEKIDQYISEYERMKGFKLEEKQRKAVHLIDNRVAIITGPAGSGKTTVSDCMVYVLERISDAEIEYAAPTGKAAKRLQEVVKQEAQTLNSKFQIFGGTDSLFDEDKESASDPNTVFFFDEMSMANLNLLYRVFRRLAQCQLFLIGDVSQLPPIGKGHPFKDLLKYLPCVKLNVSKRSAENSGITYNSNVINEYSELTNWKDLKETDDFKIIPCSEDAIKRLVNLICKYHLNKISDTEYQELCNMTGRTDFLSRDGIEPDDIQVVTPVGKEAYTWGTYQLNDVLRKTFNDVKGYDNFFKYQVSDNYKGTKFAIGDRVIHTNKNVYSMQWYSSVENGVLQKRYGFGISNGEVGKIVGILKADECIIENEVDEIPEDFEYPLSLRDDNIFIDDGNYFIAVEYFDYITDSKFYILYRAEENLNVDNSDCIALVGDDLKMMSLFYAGTVHKMQGSQSKLVISIIGKVNFSGFITRNMLYTGVTRASEGVYLIGSVGKEMNSQLSIARGSIADDDTMTVEELLYS